jgi:hypothetical protein
MVRFVDEDEIDSRYWEKESSLNCSGLVASLPTTAALPTRKQADRGTFIPCSSDARRAVPEGQKRRFKNGVKYKMVERVRQRQCGTRGRP